MQAPRHATSSAEESSASSNNSLAAGAAVAGTEASVEGWQALQTAATVTEAAATASVASVAEATTGTATTTMTTTTKAAKVRHAGQQQHQQQLIPMQTEQQSNPLPPLRRLQRVLTTAHRAHLPLPSSLRDLAPSDESGEDADDEDEAEELAAFERPGNIVAQVEEDEEAAEDDDDNDGDDEADEDGVELAMMEGQVAADELVQVEETDFDEDLHTSEDDAPTARPWPATNEDYVEFSIATDANATVSARPGVNGWGERHHRDTWRLFRLRRAATTGRRLRRRRLSMPGLSSCSAAPSPMLSPSALSRLHLVRRASDLCLCVPDAFASASAYTSFEPAVDDVSLSPDLLDLVLREADLGRGGCRGGSSSATPTAGSPALA